MPNKVIVTSLSHLDTFCTRCQNGGKWWKFIRRRQSSKQNGKVRLNVFLAIHFRLSSLHLVLVLFDTINKPPGFSPNLQVFWPWSPGFWSFGVERSARGPLFKWTHIKRTPYIILSEQMAHFVWRLSSHFYCKTTLCSGDTNSGHVGIHKLQFSL